MQTPQEKLVLRRSFQTYLAEGTELLRAVDILRFRIGAADLSTFGPSFMTTAEKRALLDIAADFMEELAYKSIDLGSHKWEQLRSSFLTLAPDMTTPKPPAGEPSEQLPKETIPSSRPSD